MFVCGDIKSYPCISKSPTFVNAKSTEHNIVECFLSIFEQKQELPEKTIDEQKLCYIASQLSISDYFGISQANYLALDKNEKSRMFSEYYNKLV